MLSKTLTVSFSGIDVREVSVEVQISSGLPKFAIVGLPDKEVSESKERVQSAFHAIGITLPPKRIIVNLAPADLPKAGSHFDLPIAVGLLSAMDILPNEEIHNYVMLGELGLDGSVSHVNGVLPAAIYANAQDKGFICPQRQGAEALWSGNEEVLAAPDLISLINHFKGNQILPSPEKKALPLNKYNTDFSDIKGQENAKRAMEVAAAGGHNLLMIGSPGAGKSMLAERIVTILPPLDAKEALEVSMIHSVAGILGDEGLIKERPFRAPHHSASIAAITGGGAWAKPGEVSLAHRGVLFLDELPEFARNTLESLRQPLEAGHITVARAKRHVTYPSKFQLIAAMNPCKCGHLGNPALECNKAPRCAVEYQNKLSGPLLDRIDMHVQVDAITPFDLEDKKTETSEVIRERVIKARIRQQNRYNSMFADNDNMVFCNADLSSKALEEMIDMDNQANELLKQAFDKFHLSARGYHRILKTALTIADLDESEIIRKKHMAEALTYRRIVPGRAVLMEKF